MINCIMRIGLKWHKRKVLLEVRKDMEFLQEMKGEKLHFDEEDARTQLAELRKSDLPDEEKEKREKEISKLIHSSQAVKAEYELKAQMEVDLMNYIDLI